MSIVFLLIPLGLVLVGLAAWAFVWAVNHDQFDDLDRAAHSILFDDDEAPGTPEPTPPQSTADAAADPAAAKSPEITRAQPGDDDSEHR